MTRRSDSSSGEGTIHDASGGNSAVTVWQADTPETRLLGPLDIDVETIAEIFRSTGCEPSIEGRWLVHVSENRIPVTIALQDIAPLLRIAFSFRMRRSVSKEDRCRWMNDLNADAWGILFHLDDEDNLVVTQDMHFGAGITAGQLLATYRHFIEEVFRRIDRDDMDTYLGAD